jgi:hypothetical protein
VQPQRLPSGRPIGEPRMWLRQPRSPGLLISRSLGDLMVSDVGCTSEPEVRPCAPLRAPAPCPPAPRPSSATRATSLSTPCPPLSC